MPVEGQAFCAVFMRSFVTSMIPLRPACDTTSDVVSEQDRGRPTTSQTPRDSALSSLARRPASASESAQSRVSSHTPIDRSYQKRGFSADCVARSKTKRGGRLRGRTTVDRAPDHISRRNLFAYPLRPSPRRYAWPRPPRTRAYNRSSTVISCVSVAASKPRPTSTRRRLDNNTVNTPATSPPETVATEPASSTATRRLCSTPLLPAGLSLFCCFFR